MLNNFLEAIYGIKLFKCPENVHITVLNSTCTCTCFKNTIYSYMALKSDQYLVQNGRRFEDSQELSCDWPSETRFETLTVTSTLICF